MTILIEELKKEHSEIVAALNEVKKLGILSKEGQDKLMSLEASLLAHLEMEDDQLYPALRKKAKHNKDLKNTLDLFIMDMENVSKIVRGFFDKYSEGVIDSAVPDEFESLFAAFRNRIRNEEDILYDEHEKINQ